MTEGSTSWTTKGSACPDNGYCLPMSRRTAALAAPGHQHIPLSGPDPQNLGQKVNRPVAWWFQQVEFQDSEEDRDKRARSLMLAPQCIGLKPAGIADVDHNAILPEECAKGDAGVIRGAHDLAGSIDCGRVTAAITWKCAKIGESCRTGVCHTCECGLVSGSVKYDPEPLEPPAAGNLLICCSRPREDLVIDI
jgi:hypothetical protein